MIRSFASIVALLTMAATAATAAPQQNFDKMSVKDARIVLRDYAQCVVRQAPDDASKAVVEDWNGARLTDSRSKLIPRDCVSAAGFIHAIRFNGESLRAGLAEQLILRDPGTAPTTDALKALSPLAFHAPRPVRTTTSKGGAMSADIIASQQTAYDMAVGKIAGQQVAECVVRTHPAEARALFETPIGGDTEMAALQTLTPLLGACVPANQKIAFDRASLRGDFALSYYRLMMSARGVSWMGDPAGN